MLNSLKIGNKIFPHPLIQGPLAGVSASPFRRLAWQYSEPAFACSEMISCKTILYQTNLALTRYLHKDPLEGPVCFQLSGSDVYEVSEAVKRVTEAGADLIDLNCGCPVKKIRQKGAGSSLLTNTKILYALISSMKNSTHVPVTVKIRVAKQGDDSLNQEVARVVTEAGADALIVHGRHWTEHYETACRYDAIRYFVDEMTIPVIGNGDVSDFHSLQAMLATGCAGVMIGRAGVGQPWLIKQLLTQFRGEDFEIPSLHKIKEMFVMHIEHLAALLGSEKFAVIQARKFSKYYARQLSSRAAFSDAVNGCDNLLDLKSICQQYFI